MIRPDRTTLGESVVEEVRAVREAIDKEVGHDVARLADEARRASAAIQREFGMKSVTLPVRGGKDNGGS